MASTLTHELLPGSPAIDAGDPTLTPPPAFDQRGPGFDRVRNGRIDTGSLRYKNRHYPYSYSQSECYSNPNGYSDSCNNTIANS